MCNKNYLDRKIKKTCKDRPLQFNIRTDKIYIAIIVVTSQIEVEIVWNRCKQSENDVGTLSNDRYSRKNGTLNLYTHNLFSVMIGGSYITSLLFELTKRFIIIMVKNSTS